MIIGNQVRTGAGRENPNLTSGSMARKLDSKILDFNIETPLDDARALRGMKDNKSLYYSLLTKFVNF